MELLISIALWPWLSRAARRTLTGRNRDRLDPQRGRFDRDEVRHLLREAWRQYEELRKDLPDEPTRGSRLNVRLAALTLALHRSLCQAGVDAAYAADLVADTGWQIYRVWGRTALGVGSWGARSKRRRLERMLRLFLRFPFNAPGYLYEWEELPDGIRTEFRRCPVADFFRSQGEAEVCRRTWCTFDFPLGELAGGRYRRTKTLSQGDPVCDMLWEIR